MTQCWGWVAVPRRRQTIAACGFRQVSFYVVRPKKSKGNSANLHSDYMFIALSEGLEQAICQALCHISTLVWRLDEAFEPSGIRS